MNKKSKYEVLVTIMSYLIAIVIVGACIFISKILFEAIINSNMPDWLKYILLK